MGFGFWIYQQATERGLEIPLFCAFIVLVAVLIWSLSRIDSKRASHTSLCRHCKYVCKKKDGHAILCGTYLPDPIMAMKPKAPCPVEALFENDDQPNYMTMKETTAKEPEA